MGIKAEVVADSINPTGNRLISMLVEFPRFVLPELSRHRMFSLSVGSSRAIPVWRRIESVESDPVVPLHWGKNQKGMQAEEELEEELTSVAKCWWAFVRDSSLKAAERMAYLGVHKQIVNRLLEPFSYVKVLITATEWANFFVLRCNQAAQPEMQEVAYTMLEAYVSSRPVPKNPGEWHLPFCDRLPEGDFSIEQKRKISTARTARLSYENFDGKIEPEKDYELHDRLLADKHVSPTEAPAMAMFSSDFCKNYRGWAPYRAMIPGENQLAFNPQELLKKRPTWRSK